MAAQLADQPGYQALLGIPGVGPVLAGIFYAEIGEVGRFPTAKQLCSWAGLTPRHRESDTKVHGGSITKQGSALVRWAAIEAVQKLGGFASNITDDDMREWADGLIKGARVTEPTKSITNGESRRSNDAPTD